MTLFTIRNIISIVAGFNLAGPLFFLSLQNILTGDYFMAGFLGVVGVFGLVLPEYLMNRFIDKTIKNPMKKAGDTITEKKANVEERSESMKERLERKSDSDEDTHTDTNSENNMGDADSTTGSENNMTYTDASIGELFENTREIVSEKSKDVQDEVNKRRDT